MGPGEADGLLGAVVEPLLAVVGPLLVVGDLLGGAGWSGAQREPPGEPPEVDLAAVVQPAAASKGVVD